MKNQTIDGYVKIAVQENGDAKAAIVRTRLEQRAFFVKNQKKQGGVTCFALRRENSLERLISGNTSFKLVSDEFKTKLERLHKSL